jgi:hypothetical protein
MPGRGTRTIPRKVGVEIEVSSFRDDAIQCGETASDRLVRLGCVVKYDGSLSDANGREVVLPPLAGANFRDTLRVVCTILHSAGARADRTAGCHVHVDAPHLRRFRYDSAPSLEVRKLCWLWQALEPGLYAACPTSRRNNSFCQRMRQSIREEIYVGQDNPDWYFLVSDRYRGINFCAVEQHGTVEFRLWAGTVDYHKIVMHAGICARLVEYARTHTLAEIEALAALAPRKIEREVFTGQQVAYLEARRSAVGAT